MLRTAMSLSRKIALGSNADWLLRRRSKVSLIWYCSVFFFPPTVEYKALFQICIPEYLKPESRWEEGQTSNFSLTSSAVFTLRWWSCQEVTAIQSVLAK